MKHYRQHLINTRKAKGTPSMKSIVGEAGVYRDGVFYALDTDFILHPEKVPLPDIKTLTRFTPEINTLLKKKKK